jgi:hypothetical protein
MKLKAARVTFKHSGPPSSAVTGQKARRLKRRVFLFGPPGVIPVKDESGFGLCFSGKQEAALARRLRNCYGGIAYYREITPLDFRDVSPSKDTDPRQQADLHNAANEVPFLVTASELRDRKSKRRKYRAQRP